MPVELLQQDERSFKKQPTIFSNKKRLTTRKLNRSEVRFTRNAGLGFKAPAQAADGEFIDQKCPFMLALYETNEDEKARQSAMEAIGEMLADEHASGDATTRLVGATLLAREGNYVEAMRLCHGGSSLELNAMMVNLLCKMDRAELAEKQAKMMQQIDDDSTIAQLACAWANCASGGKKIQDASYIYQELGDKYKWTPKLYNGSAVCSMMMNSYEDAERDLLEAVAIDPKDGETLANLAACALHLGKSSARFVNAMKQAGVANEALTKIASLERDFDRAAAAVVL